MRSQWKSGRISRWRFSLSLALLIAGAAFWARAGGDGGLVLGVNATQIDEGQARALAQQLKAAVVMGSEGEVKVAMSVQALADDVAAAAKAAAAKATRESAAKAARDSAATSTQKKQASRLGKRSRIRAKQKAGVNRALLDDAARLATKAGSGAAKQAQKAGEDSEQARKKRSNAKTQASKTSGAGADRPHASPESLRGGGGKAAGSAKGGASGEPRPGVGSTKKGGGLLRSTSPGSEGPGGSTGKSRR